MFWFQLRIWREIFFRIPIFLARQLGNTVAQYRWFLGVYIVLMYFIFPLFFIALSMIDGSGILTAVVTSLGMLMFACYMIVSFMRSRSNLRRRLPSFLLNWDFVPIWMRSLAPYDKYFFLTNFFKHFYWMFFYFSGFSSVIYAAEHWNQKMKKNNMQCNKDCKDWIWPEPFFSGTYSKRSRNLSLHTWVTNKTMRQAIKNLSNSWFIPTM